MRHMIPFKTFKKQVQVVLAYFVPHNFIQRHSVEDEPDWDFSGEEDNDAIPKLVAPDHVDSDDDEDYTYLRNRYVIAQNLWMRYRPPV